MLENELKQDEIDAMFRAAQTDAVHSNAGQEADLPSPVCPYDFSSSGQISNEQMRAVSMLNDLFARNLSQALAAWLRTTLQVSLVSAEQLAFNEFLLRVPDLSYMASVRLEPLGTLSLLQIDPTLAPPIIDLLLGGNGKEGRLRELTEIEDSIFDTLAEIISHELTIAWRPVELTFSFECRQMRSQVTRTMSVLERALCLSFEVRLHNCAGLLTVAFPAAAANAILRRLATDWSDRRRDEDSRRRLEELASRMRFGCSLQLPRVKLRAYLLTSLQPGSLLDLNLAGKTVQLLNVAGQSLFEAHAVRQGTHRVARVERRILQMKK